MEQIHSDLTNLGYDGPALDNNVFNSKVFNTGPPNVYFVDIVSWLSSQLVSLCELESHISPVEDEEELGGKAIGFLVEFSSLLKELGKIFRD
ncbi:UNVERIFIED_CONTAM: hypothetical protein NCL1_25513 [Trichonephila clavipes]